MLESDTCSNRQKTRAYSVNVVMCVTKTQQLITCNGDTIVWAKSSRAILKEINPKRCQLLTREACIFNISLEKPRFIHLRFAFNYHLAKPLQDDSPIPIAGSGKKPESFSMNKPVE